MNYRNTLALIAALLLFGAGQLVNAQSQGDSGNPPGAGVQDGRGPGRRPGFDRPNLNLTADQKAKLKALHESERQQIDAVRNDAALSPEEKKAKIRSISQAARPQFQALLTPEQQQLLKSGHDGRGFGGPGPRGGPLTDLGLTTDQRSQIDAIHKGTREQVNAIRSDTTLSSEQKEAKLKTLLQNSQQQVSGILTPEQQQKLREEHQRGPGRFGRGGRYHEPAEGAGPAVTPPPQA